MEYILMNKNMPVMEVSKEEGETEFFSVGRRYNTDFSPLILQKSLNKSDDEFLAILNQWYNDRAIPNDRDEKNRILEKFQIQRAGELLNMDYGLSLSDQYWLKPVDEDVDWEDINYFHNDYDSREFFDAVYGDGTFHSLQINSTESDKYRTPNNSLTGQLKKAWVKINGENWMFKGSNTTNGFEQINEVLASDICEVLEVPHVEYTLKTIEDKRNNILMSACPCLIDDKTEMINAYEILYGEDLYGDERDLQRYIEILEEHHVPNAREYVEKMFMLDYIILNEDRHMGNFAVIRNVENLVWERVCPIYDSGRSMCTNVTEGYWDFRENDVKCFSKRMISSERLPACFTVPIRQTQINALRNIAGSYTTLLKDNQKYIKLFDEQIQKLHDGLNQRIDIFESMMKEKNLIINDQDLGIKNFINKAQDKKSKSISPNHQKKSINKER